MKTPNKKMIMVNEENIINQLSKISPYVALLERARGQFIEVFGSFDIDKFILLIDTTRRKNDITAFYMKEKKVEFPGLKIDMLMKEKLIDIPDISDLFYTLNRLRTEVFNLPFGDFIRNNIAKMYDPKLKKFPKSSEGDNEIYRMIREKNTLQPQNQQEVAFMEDLFAFAEMYNRFKNVHKVPPYGDIPANMFMIYEKEGKPEIRINASALLQYRQRNNPTNH